MTLLLLSLALSTLPARADEAAAPPAPEPAVEIDADITIDGLQIQLETGKEGQGEIRISVDGQELVIQGDQAHGQLQLGELSIKAEGDRLRIEDASGGEGVIELDAEESTED